MARKRRRKKKNNYELISKIMMYISAGLLIGFGWYTEVYWYQFRFVSDGNGIGVAIAQGIALTLFLSVAAVMGKGWGKNLLLACLVIYSVFATAAGQSYSLELVRLENYEQQVQRDQAERSIERIDESIAEKETEISRLSEIKKEQTQSIADQSLWRTALANLNEDIDELESDISELESEKLGIIGIGNIKPDDIYTRYSKLTGIPVTIIESVFQLALSLFIALMAPVGLYMWPSKKFEKKKEEEKKIEPVEQEPIEHVDISVLEEYASVSFGQTDENDGYFPHQEKMLEMSTSGKLSYAKLINITEEAVRRGLVVVENRKHRPADFISAADFLREMKK